MKEHISKYTLHSWAGEVAQWLTHLLCMLVDWSLGPQSLCKCWVAVVACLELQPQKVETVSILSAGWLVRLALSVSSGFVAVKKVDEVLSMTSNTSLGLLCAHTKTHTLTHMHPQACKICKRGKKETWFKSFSITPVPQIL